MAWSGRTYLDTCTDNFIPIKMDFFKQKLDAILTSGINSIPEVIKILGISKNELLVKLTKIKGKYSTAGITSEYGTITKDK